MKNQLKKANMFVIFCFISIIFVALMAFPANIYSQGMRGMQQPGFGPGGPGCGSGGPGMGMGMGLQRGCGSHQGFGGMNMQRGMMREPPYCRMLMDRPDLNLTPKQRDDIKKIQVNHMKETFDLRTDLQIKKIELKKLRFAKDPDFGLIKEKLEKISELQLDLQLKRAKLQLEADKILTRTQKDLLYLSPGMSVDIDWDLSMEGEETPEPENGN